MTDINDFYKLLAKSVLTSFFLRRAAQFLCFLAAGVALQSGLSFKVSAEIKMMGELPYDTRLEPQIQFWKKVYSELSQDEGWLHDAQYPKLIYEKVSTRKSNQSKRKWNDLLLSVHEKTLLGKELTSEEKKIVKLFESIDEPNKYLNATHRKRLRFQRGLKESFEQAIKRSGEYLPLMEAIFRKKGAPIELTRLPFVESSFNTSARSKVGASGIWQFMPYTGRSFLEVSDLIDERNDPLRATEGAAELLLRNYKKLGSWDLAVTAYNHGRKNLMRATRALGATDLASLMEKSKYRHFGFASRNFYTELLAAIEVERESKSIFGDIEKNQLIEFIEFRIPKAKRYQQVLECLKVSDHKEIRALNPAIEDEAYQKNFEIPGSYRFRIPCGQIYDTKCGFEVSTQCS